IGHHLMHRREISQPLFRRVILESGATTSRAVWPANSKLHKIQFEEFLLETGCDAIAQDYVLPCLRSKPAREIARASIAVFDRYDRSNRWAFQPVIDGEIIGQAPIRAWESGQWLKVPILTGFNTDEGAPFSPPGLATSEEFNNFFTELIPGLPKTDLRKLNDLYPDPTVDPSSPYAETRPIRVGAQYKRTTAAYGQFAYICPVQQTARFASAGQKPPVFLYHWAVNKTVQSGASHATQVEYEEYSPSVRRISKTQDELAGFLHAYFTSFITTGDPNSIKGKYGHRPYWKQFFANQNDNVMVFGKGNDERAGGGSIGMSAELGDTRWLHDECTFWWERSILTES
ncbi:hypothetical protein FQN57_003155, partial [Myotisia sp. PD_48]